VYKRQGQSTYTPWNPLNDIAQCAEMECLLAIDLSWEQVANTAVIAKNFTEFGELENYFLSQYEDHPSKQAARMAASTAVAAMIGERL
jgi:hypothetical protein